MYVEDKAGAGGQRPRFSPLKMVARALGARPADEITPEADAPRAPVRAATPAFEAAPAAEVSGESFLAIVNAMVDADDETRLGSDDAEFDLVALIGEAHDAFAGAAERQGVTLALAVAPGAPGTYGGDALRVRQALLNLLAGALKATSDDVLELTAAWDGALTLHVAGAETAAQMARVLVDGAQPSRRRPAAYRLALARSTAMSLGGDLRATSRDGVEMTLPLRKLADSRSVAPRERLAPAYEPALIPAPAPAPAPVTIAPPAPSLPAFASGLRVLVAEDSPAHQQVLTTLLAGMGLEAVVVNDGQDVVRAWREERWDALLIDIEGEGICGRNVASSIRAAEAKARWPRMPIVALAAHVKIRDLDEDFAEVIDGLVAKPIHAGSLHTAIEAAMNGEVTVSATKGWMTQATG